MNSTFSFRVSRSLAILLVVALLNTAAASAQTPVASPVVSSALDPVVERYRADFAEDLDRFPTYTLDLILDDRQSTLSGSLELIYPNATGETLSFLPLRLYPNADYYGEGGTSIASIEINGMTVTPRFDDSGTVLFLDLSAPLAPGEVLAAEIEFTTVIPRNSEGSFGIFNHAVGREQFVLSDWYPIVAGRDDSGWRLEPPTIHGDPTFAETSVFDVRLSVPSGYRVVATGIERTGEDGRIDIDSGPVREFAMVVAKGFDTTSRMVGETEISVAVSPENLANGEHILDLAQEALVFYDNAFGPYPYRELDFVETPLALALGVSWSGILFIDDGPLALPVEQGSSLDFTILHEIGHQWWGGVVGANSNDHTWMVEGLTNATAVLAQAAVQGPSSATSYLHAWIVGPYLNLLESSGDSVADVSIFNQSVNAPLSTLAYGKGALGFLAIRNEIGNDAFLRGLATFTDSFRLEVAEPADLLASFENASGQELDALWTYWFESAVTTRADVESLTVEIAASLADVQ